MGGGARGPATPPALPGVLVAGHFREGAGYHVRRAHGTPDWLLTYTTGGTGVYRQNGGGPWPAEPGDLWLLAPGAEHDYATDAVQGVWEFWWVHFVPRPGWAEWLRWPSLGRGLSHLRIEEPRTRPRLRRVWERLVADARGMGALHEELAQNALEEVLLIAARDRRAPGGAVDARVQDTLEHMAAHLADAHTLAALAARVSLSPSRLGHLFQAQVGMGLVQALAAMRLREAARLLEFTDRAVAEVATDLGFGSPSYFFRRFTQRYGEGPRAYRSRVRERRR